MNVHGKKKRRRICWRYSSGVDTVWREQWRGLGLDKILEKEEEEENPRGGGRGRHQHWLVTVNSIVTEG